MKHFANLALASSFTYSCILASPLSYPGRFPAMMKIRTNSDTNPGNIGANTGPAASEDPNESFYSKFMDSTPKPMRGSTGGDILNVPLGKQNADLLAPPSTDHGTVPNAKWPFALSHNLLKEGGYARQQNVNQLPAATQMAGVDMRLEPGAIRELHWHTANEWSYMLKGRAIVGVVNADGQNYLAEVNEGDLWYFPEGQPHYIQASNDTIGCEFLLVFDTGDFSEYDTFLLTDWTAHIPKSILDKNFGFELNSSAFDDIPASELYIFDAPNPASVEAQAVSAPNGQTPLPLTYALSKQKPVQYEGGSVKIADSKTFKASKTIAAALVELEPGALREIHWHPNSDEWEYYIEGVFRTGVFAASSDAATFDFEAGDVGYIKQNNGHWIECISNTTCKFLEVLRAPKFEDISLSQWLALTPVQVVADHLRVSNETIAQFHKNKTVIVPAIRGVS